MKPRRRTLDMWYAFTNSFVKITGAPVWWLCSRPKTYYEDTRAQNKKIKGKAIVVCNHKSVFDVAMMLFLFWRRTLRCLVAEIMYQKNALMTVFLKSIGCIKIDRTAHDFSFIQKSCDILQKGGVIEVYPESRLPKDGEETPLPFKPSVVHIALQSGAPIVPVYTNGAYFQKRRARMIIGKPIDMSALYDDAISEKENLQNLTEYLRNRIIELGNELERQSGNATQKEKTE